MSEVSVIIPWRQRPELRNTLAANASFFARSSAEVIVVNCGGDPQEVASLIEDQNIPVLRHILIPTSGFNRSLTRNIGALFSSCRSMFFLDADIVLKSDIFGEALPLLDECNCFIKVRRVCESRPRLDPSLSFLRERVTTDELICEDGRRAVLQFVMGGDGSRCGSGLLLVKKEHFLAVQGFDSDLDGWGFEDIDFQVRLQFVSHITPRLLGDVTHLSHGDDVRGLKGSSRGEDQQNNMLKCYMKYCRASFLGTYQNDILRWQENTIELPVVTHYSATTKMSY